MVVPALYKAGGSRSPEWTERVVGPDEIEDLIATVDAVLLDLVRCVSDCINIAVTRNQPQSRDSPVGRFHTHHTAERGRLPDGATGVRAQRDWREARSHRRGRPT